MSYTLLFIGGFMNLLTPGGLVFLAITILLPIAAIFLKKKILIYVSLFILVATLFLYLTVPFPFPIYLGPIQGAIITGGNFLDKLAHNLGFVSVPLLVSIVTLKLSDRKNNH